MSRKPLDLPRIRAELAKLDTLARQHPEAFRQTTEQWERTLRDDDNRKEKQAMAHDTQIGVRLPGELVERLDEFVEQWREEQPGALLTRSDAVRMLLTRALDAQDEAD